MIELCVVLCRVSGLRGTMAKLLLYRRTTLIAGANICTFPLSTLLTNWTIPSAICPNSTLVMLDLLKEILQVKELVVFLIVVAIYTAGSIKWSRDMGLYGAD